MYFTAAQLEALIKKHKYQFVELADAGSMKGGGRYVNNHGSLFAFPILPTGDCPGGYHVLATVRPDASGEPVYSN